VTSEERVSVRVDVLFKSALEGFDYENNGIKSAVVHWWGDDGSRDAGAVCCSSGTRCGTSP